MKIERPRGEAPAHNSIADGWGNTDPGFGDPDAFRKASSEYLCKVNPDFNLYPWKPLQYLNYFLCLNPAKWIFSSNGGSCWGRGCYLKYSFLCPGGVSVLPPSFPVGPWRPTWDSIDKPSPQTPQTQTLPNMSAQPGSQLSSSHFQSSLTSHSLQTLLYIVWGLWALESCRPRYISELIQSLGKNLVFLFSFSLFTADLSRS